MHKWPLVTFYEIQNEPVICAIYKKSCFGHKEDAYSFTFDKNEVTFINVGNIFCWKIS